MSGSVQLPRGLLTVFQGNLSQWAITRMMDTHFSFHASVVCFCFLEYLSIFPTVQFVCLRIWSWSYFYLCHSIFRYNTLDLLGFSSVYFIMECVSIQIASSSIRHLTLFTLILSIELDSQSQQPTLPVNIWWNLICLSPVWISRICKRQTTKGVE